MSVLGETFDSELFEHQVVFLFHFISFDLALVFLPQYYLRCNMSRNAVSPEVGKGELIHQVLLLFFKRSNLFIEPRSLISCPVYIRLFGKVFLHLFYFLLIPLQLLKQSVTVRKGIATIYALRTGFVLKYEFKPGFHVFVHFQE